MARDRRAPLALLLVAALAVCAPALRGAAAVTAAAATSTAAAVNLTALINSTQCEWDASAQSCGLSGAYMINAFVNSTSNTFAAAVLMASAAKLACGLLAADANCTANANCVPAACAASPRFAAATKSSMMCPGYVAVSYLPCKWAGDSTACAAAGSKCVWSGASCAHQSFLALDPATRAEVSEQLASFHPDVFGNCTAFTAYSAYVTACGATGDAVDQDQCADRDASCAWRFNACIPTSLALAAGAFGANASSPAAAAAKECWFKTVAPACAEAGRDGGPVRVAAALVAAVAAGDFELVDAPEEGGPAGEGGMFESGLLNESAGNVSVAQRGGGGAARRGALCAALLAALAGAAAAPLLAG
ncbi:hypothetical protein Rsub_04715 [Raphidocelis subcapitata]|uniref:Folate receptor-like domain-containing protein n=1 Tax=Raphidocelis subcapitata TaxID=307507 RepID=A0A2V0NWI9_9CHLO|nr:hypothetical protein Rsub_04715 [Raphidocelis subcapitata]|eukprot:GBF91991.1 hypothetical protein Rsub_04715 [Raphidocelis subcapitata]